MKIVVASTNPVKIKATEIGFDKMFAGESFDIEGVSAPSEVADQPVSEQETLLGATNRVNNVAKLAPDADYWVGIEGGIDIIGNEMETFAWVVVQSKDGVVGKGRTGSFFLPDRIVKLINDGKEFSEADDIVFGRTNSKQSNGTIGILTRDTLTRITFYESAVILALIPFKNPQLY